MLGIAIVIMIAVATAAVTTLWAWHDHVVTHPWAARPSGGVERAVDRWERLATRAARPVLAVRRTVR